MELEDLKIDAYAQGVSDMPDDPSDAGYTAEQIKAIFDARSNNEIKEKHNALVDEVAGLADDISSQRSEMLAHKNDADAHGVDELKARMLALADTLTTLAEKLDAHAVDITSHGLNDLEARLYATENEIAYNFEAIMSDILLLQNRVGAAEMDASEHETASNPHGITKATVGLDKVDNTSDEAKPVSAAQAAAIETAKAEAVAEALEEVSVIEGPQGEQGPQGDAGYTPRRGTDYWTQADIAEIKDYVDDAILGGAW